MASGVPAWKSSEGSSGNRISGVAPTACPQDRSPRGQRLDSGQAEALELPRGQDEHVRRLVVPGKIRLGDVAQEPDVLSEPEGVGEGFQIPSEGARAADQEHGLGDAPAKAIHGPDQLSRPIRASRFRTVSSTVDSAGKPEGPAHRGRGLRPAGTARCPPRRGS